MSTGVLVRTSERKTFKGCRWQWNISYNMGLEPVTAAPALRFGTLVHKSMEKFFRPGLRRGPKPAETFQKLYAAELEEQASFGFKDEDGTWYEAGHLGVAMLEGYYDLYGKDDEWFIVGTEQPFSVPIYRKADLFTKGSRAGKPRPGRKPLFTYVGVIDGIRRSRSTQEIRLWDYKTAKSISVNHLVLDEQAGAYWTFGVDWLYKKRILKTGQELSGITFDLLRKAMPDSRPRNELGQYLNQNGTVSKQQPAPYFHREPVWRDDSSRAKMRARVLNEFDDMAECRQNDDKIYKNPGQMTCGGCGFRDVCELHEYDQDWQALLKATTQSWDGYSEHAIQDGEYGK